MPSLHRSISQIKYDRFHFLRFIFLLCVYMFIYVWCVCRMCESKCLHIRWHQIPGVGIKHNCVLPDGKNFNFKNILNKIKINVKWEPLIVIFILKLNVFIQCILISVSHLLTPPRYSPAFLQPKSTLFFLSLEYKQASDQNNKNDKIK